MARRNMSLSSIERNNPQWIGRSVLTRVGYRRKIFESVLKAVYDNKVVIIEGPLGVGKSTLVKHIVNELYDVVGGSNILYLPCDTETIRVEEAKTYFFENVSSGGGDVYVFLDEFLMMPNYKEFVSDLLKRENVHIVMVTSYSPEKYFDLGVSYKRFIIKPLTFREFLEFHGYDSPSLGRDPIEVRNFYIEHIEYDSLYEKYLLRGGFPAYDLDMEDDDVRRRVRDNLQLLLYKYFTRIGRRRRPVIADRLLAQICFEPGEAVNYNVLSQSIERDIRTVSSYIKTLSDAFMINIVRHMVDDGHEGRKLPKIYPYSPAYPLSLHPQRMPEREFMASIVESHIVLERGVKTYIRRASGVDVLIHESGDGKIPILVTYGKRGSKRDVKKVVNTLRKLGSDWGFLVVKETYEFLKYGDMDVWVVPAWLFSLIEFGQ